MNISAATDYGVRAALHLAKSHLENPENLITTDEIAKTENIPVKFLEGLIRRLKLAGLVESRRGINGGHQLSLAPKEISLADVIRAIDGPLAAVKGKRPESFKYKGSSAHLTEVWIAVRSAMRSVLEEVTLEDVVKGKLPNPIRKAIAQPGAWERR